ncbi:hypothetical protein C1T17_00935 [Sphingobium sp. SCG-1]|uniref:TMEM165/GDT1 family protein n=1 Tax=Sphingobium sp. SCG-1 TaxID=2072936 RepID=UPI000CD675B8|nr:TMEM165/GDT1 family protein [Sphingobium sp. SCG-1]AUW56851.1 hypothetical protein C1T17_00935 [Sphingobium sp. SCG-1]
MDALLSTLLACLLCEIGGGSQRLAMALAQRFARNRAILAGVAIAALANAIISAGAGWYISTLLSTDARSLLLAVAIGSAGAGLLLKARQPDLLERWRTGPFTTTLLGISILSFGDAAQFIIVGIAARMADPVPAAVGGCLGIFMACVPVVITRHPLAKTSVLAAVRRITGATFIIIGSVLGLSATGLL